jgi:dTDP-4-dehydrorhamnose 3,5-epimerase
MKIEPLPICGAFRLIPEPLGDGRGFFARCFDSASFADHGMIVPAAQGSISYNRRRGTLRGLHYQTGAHAETKLIRCTLGAAYDAIADMREGSPTFGEWHAEILSGENRVSLYVPPGVAHGFQTLVDGTEISYAISPAYFQDAAAGVRWNDPYLDIPWPIAPDFVSAKDLGWPSFNERAR